MIKTLAKRVVFVGDYRKWILPPPHKWLDFDDPSNKDLSWKEITKNLDSNDYTDIYSRIIDQSEFVVRCSALRTRSNQFQSNQIPYGSKIDALVLRQKSLLTLPNSADSYMDNIYFDDTEMLYNLHYLYGFPIETNLLEVSNSNEPTKMSKPEIRMYNRAQQKYYIDSVVKETWLPISYLMHMVLTDYGIRKKRYGSIEKCIESFINVRKKFSEHRGSDLKSLTIDRFIELIYEKLSLWCSFEELSERYGHCIWWKEYIEHKKSNPFIKKRGFSQAVKEERDVFYMTRGLESIHMIMSDPRFKSYDKYIIGVLGMDQQWSGPPNPDFFLEYRYLTSLIKKGLLKYLPHHVDELSKVQSETLRNNKITIF